MSYIEQLKGGLGVNEWHSGLIPAKLNYLTLKAKEYISQKLYPVKKYYNVLVFFMRML